MSRIIHSTINNSKPKEETINNNEDNNNNNNGNNIDAEVDDDDWKSMRFFIYDTIQLDMKFEDRIDYLRNNLPSDHPTVTLVNMRKCKSEEDLISTSISTMDEYESNSSSNSSEITSMTSRMRGLFLRQPEAYYHDTQSFLKYQVINFIFVSFLY